ncbi:MAG: antitoxin Xre-like helix-turn-helix domain-containing protein [Pseudomonadota bacterium]
MPSLRSALLDLVLQGLPFDVLGQLASLVGVERKVLCQSMHISKTTLARRAEAGRFSTEESDRLLALAVVLQAAGELFEGDVGAVGK